jgi:diguanylate cyclase (GGDEF)-like protein/PAS domain S-box-containing protein
MFATARPIVEDQVTGAPGSGQASASQVGTDIGLGQLFNLAQDMLCVAGVDGYLKAVNPAWQRTLGWTAEELTSRPHVDFMHPADRETAHSAPDVLIAGQHVVHYENRYRTRDGSFRWISWMATPSPEHGVIYAAGHDITKAKLEGEVSAAKTAVTRIAAEVEGWDEAAWQVLKAVCGCLRWDVGGLWLVDADEQQLVWKQAYFGSDELRDVLGQPLRNDRRRFGESLVGLVWELDEPLFSEDVLSDSRFAAPAVAVRAGLGGGFAFPIRHAGEVIGVIGFGSREIECLDLDLRAHLKELAAQIEDVLDSLATRRDTYHMAFHDALTGLPNRALFRERASQALLMSRRLNMPVGIGLADVDRFKEINDTLGHAAGDRVLREVGARLVEALRGSDTVARFGGDEFAILFPATSVEGVDRAMRKLRAALSPGLMLEGLEPIHVSVGCAIAARGEGTLDDLLKTADANMYRRKRRRSLSLEQNRVGSDADGLDGDATDLRGMSRRPPAAHS